MKDHRRQTFSWAVRSLSVFSVAFSMATQVAADENPATTFPDRPVKLIVPVAAGGSSDTIARLVADKLREKWDQNVIVENLPGGGGLIGVSRFLKTDPDGYTLLAHGDAVVLNPLLRSNADYTLEDLKGINRFVVNPQVLVVHPDFPPRTLEEYVDYAKEKPGEIRLALPTQAGIGHLTHAKLETEADIKVSHIPYKGGAPAAVDTLGGHVDALIITLAAVSEYIKNGQLIPLAVSTPERSPLFPDVPTMAESGYPEVIVESWQGVLGPKDMPQDIAEKVQKEVVEVMSDPEVRKTAESLGFKAAPMESLEAFNEWLRQEHEKHDTTIKGAKLLSQ